MPKLMLFAVELTEQNDVRVNPRRVAIRSLQNLLSEFAVAKDEVLEKLKAQTVPDGAKNLELTVTYDQPEHVQRLSTVRRKKT